MEQNNLPISKQVKIYIERKPYILEAIEQNIVNYSSLAREICKELNMKNKDAVKAALIRISKRNRKIKRKTQEKAIEILRDANFSISNKIATLHHSTFVNIKAIAYSKTPSGYMFFLDENIARKSTFRNIEYGFAILHIKSSKEIEHTPGVIAFILSALASNGINVSHVMGCREDTFLVVKEYDAPLAFRILAERLRII
jgi:aspartokinase